MPLPTAVLKMAFFPALINSPFPKILQQVISIHNKSFLKCVCPIYQQVQLSSYDSNFSWVLFLP